MSLVLIPGYMANKDLWSAFELEMNEFQPFT